MLANVKEGKALEVAKCGVGGGFAGLQMKARCLLGGAFGAGRERRLGVDCAGKVDAGCAHGVVII